jgi:hypothetical protein
MSNHEKSLTAALALKAGYERMGKTIELRTCGNIRQAKIGGQWYDIHGNFKRWWCLRSPVRNKALVHQTGPWTYEVFLVPAQQMKKIVQEADKEHLDNGDAIWIEEGQEREHWPSKTGADDWERSVLDITIPKIRNMLIPFKVF